MTATLRFAHLLALMVWIGSVVFLFVTAQALFTALPRELAGRATAAIFPRYYLLGGVCAIAAILSALLLGWRAGSFGRALTLEIVLLVIMGGLTLYAGQVLLPEADSIRLSLPALEGTPAHETARARFGRLHGESVLLTGAVLLLGLGIIGLLAVRPPLEWGR
jgi:hypothetical protein